MPIDTEPTIETFSRGLKVQVRVLNAVFIREIMMRYGRDNLGFLWIFIEPMLLCVGVMLLWSFIHAPFEHGIGVITIVLTGYMPLTLWRHLTVQAGIKPFSRSLDMLYHRQVSMLDIFTVRCFLEFTGATAAFLVVTLILLASGLVDQPHDLGIIILGWLSMALFSTAIALVTAVLSETYEPVEKFIAVYQYISLPLSGTFFMVDWLPTNLQKIALYNPTVHCYEMIRHGFLGNDARTFYDPWYPIVAAILLIAAFIGFIGRMRDHLER